MKKIALLIIAISAFIAGTSSLPAVAEERYPRFVIWNERADLYPDARLAGKADRLEDAVKPGDVVVLNGRSSSGNYNVRTMGIDGWAKPAKFTEVTLAVCTGDNVNVRGAPKTGKAYKILQLYKGQSVLITDKKDLGEKYPWYKIKMFSTHECWVYGQFLKQSVPLEESVAAELRYLEEMTNEKGDRNLNAIPAAGIKRGGKANLLNEPAALLNGAGWIGPMELKDGDNRYVNTLRIMQERIPSVLHVRVKGGVVSEIAFARRVD